MAGHNKWSKIKRQKAKEDKRKSKVWARLSRDIALAAREGGGDPAMNAELANAIERAEAENMPKDTIDRAVKRGTGELEGQDYEPATYEGYAAHGIAVFIDALTDNTNRTVADLRYVFGKYNGSLGKDGSVSYLFDRKGRIAVPEEACSELELFELVVEAGADDLEQEEKHFIITTPVDRFDEVKAALREAGIELEDDELVCLPTTTQQLGESETETVLHLIEDLEELDDVQAVYTTLQQNGETIEA